MADRINSLLDENMSLRKALASAKSSLDRMGDDYKTLKTIHEELKNHNSSIEKENKELFFKIEALTQDKKEIEQQFDTTIRNLKSAIEQKQKEIEEVQTKVIPVLDQDMIKIKLINELETPHKLQMEAKSIEIEKLQEETYELKRQLELALTKCEAIQTEREKEIKAFQQKNKMDISELMGQITELTEKLDDNRDKELIRNLKRENDELRQRLNSKDSEIDEIHNYLNRAKEEKQQLFVKLTTKLDQEKEEKLSATSSRDKLQKRVALLDEDIKKNNEKLSQKILVCERMEKELMEARIQINNKEDVIRSLYKKIDEKFEENLQLSQKHKDEIFKLMEENSNAKRNIETEKNRIIDKLQIDIEDLLQIKERNLKEIDNNKRYVFNLNEEIREIKAHNNELLKRIDSLELLNQDKENEKNRLNNNIKSLKQMINQDEIPVKDIEKNHFQTTQQIKASNPSENNQNFKEESILLKSKIKKYKDTLERANKKIMDLVKEKAVLLQNQEQKKQAPFYRNWESQKELPSNQENFKANTGFINKKSPLINTNEKERGFSYDLASRNINRNKGGAQISYKDEILLEEIQKSINNGMQFYKL